jgi:hypothetical protein
MQLGGSVQLAPPSTSFVVEGTRQLRIDAAADGARASMYWAVRTEALVE